MMTVAGLLFAEQFRHIWDSVKRHRTFVQISQSTWPWSNESECCPPRGSLFSDGSQRWPLSLRHQHIHTYMHLAGVDAHACCSSKTPDVCGQAWHGSGRGWILFPLRKDCWGVVSLFFTCSTVWGDCGNHRATDSQIARNAFSEVFGMLYGILFQWITHKLNNKTKMNEINK